MSTNVDIDSTLSTNNIDIPVSIANTVLSRVATRGQVAAGRRFQAPRRARGVVNIRGARGLVGRLQRDLEAPFNSAPSTRCGRRSMRNRERVMESAPIKVRHQNSKPFGRERGLHLLEQPDERRWAADGSQASCWLLRARDSARDGLSCS